MHNILRLTSQYDDNFINNLYHALDLIIWNDGNRLIVIYRAISYHILKEPVENTYSLLFRLRN